MTRFGKNSLRLAAFVRCLPLNSERQRIVAYLLRGFSARKIARRASLHERAVYQQACIIRGLLRVQGLGGLAQRVFAGVLAGLRSVLDPASGLTLVPMLEQVRSKSSSKRRTETPRYADVEDVRLEDIVDRIGLPYGRQREVARQILRDLTHAEAAAQLNIDPSTLENHLERVARKCRCLSSIDAASSASNKPVRRVLIVADACFVAWLMALQAELAKRAPSVDLEAALRRIRCGEA